MAMNTRALSFLDTGSEEKLIIDESQRTRILQWITGEVVPTHCAELEGVVQLYVKCLRKMKNKRNWNEKETVFLRCIPVQYKFAAAAKHDAARMFMIQSIEYCLLSLYCILELE
jgi:hypothetical protein